jgi:hypothetical protein
MGVASRVVSSRTTVALLNMVPLGTVICGGDTQDRSAISRYFSHQILTQVVLLISTLDAMLSLSP